MPGAAAASKAEADPPKLLRASVCTAPSCGRTAEEAGVPQLLKCSRCRKSMYCGSAHQREDWPAHRPNCFAKERLTKPTRTYKNQAVPDIEAFLKSYYLHFVRCLAFANHVYPGPDTCSTQRVVCELEWIAATTTSPSRVVVMSMRVVALADDSSLVDARPYLARQPSLAATISQVVLRLRIPDDDHGFMTQSRVFGVTDALVTALRQLDAPVISPEAACAQFMRSVAGEPGPDVGTLLLAHAEFMLRDLPTATAAHARAVERLEEDHALKETLMSLPTVKFEELSPTMRALLTGDFTVTGQSAA